jgi:transcriptional regulator with XRE-family HTH domain
MSQEALATASGIDRGYMGSLCRGEHMPTVETVLKVCAGMEVPPEVFTRELMKKFRNNRKST